MRRFSIQTIGIPAELIAEGCVFSSGQVSIHWFKDDDADIELRTVSGVAQDIVDHNKNQNRQGPTWEAVWHDHKDIHTTFVTSADGTILQLQVCGFRHADVDGHFDRPVPERPRKTETIIESMGRTGRAYHRIDINVERTDLDKSLCAYKHGSIEDWVREAQ